MLVFTKNLQNLQLKLKKVKDNNSKLNIIFHFLLRFNLLRKNNKTARTSRLIRMMCPRDRYKNALPHRSLRTVGEFFLSLKCRIFCRIPCLTSVKNGYKPTKLTDWKSCKLLKRFRGFESLALRQKRTHICLRQVWVLFN